MTNEKSPYAPPESALQVEPVPLTDQHTASPWLRLINFLLDYIGTVALIIVASLICVHYLGDDVLARIAAVPEIFLGAIGRVVYYLLWETTTHRTPGKFITRTKVVSADGTPLTFRQLLGRTMVRIVPFELFSFFNNEGRGWHDRWSKTYVVKV